MADKDQTCRFCDKPAVTTIGMGDTVACAEHFVANFSEPFLAATLQEQIRSAGKILECKEIQVAIKERLPAYYEQFKDVFDV